ncbi:MAG TPA: hypothetical protein VIL74_05505 [Pyrinomonadaceae bacterium]|jgi:hypothetical protein
MKNPQSFYDPYSEFKKGVPKTHADRNSQNLPDAFFLRFSRFRLLISTPDRRAPSAIFVKVPNSL